MLPALTPDCGACAALCCIGLAFDKGPEFAIDKDAGMPCPNLSNHRCRIHADLASQGFHGCIAFDCDGAGQRAVALHGGISWQDQPDILAPLLDTFRHLRKLHNLITLLELAARLPLEAQEETDRQKLLTTLCPDDMAPEMAEQLATGPLPDQVKGFLHSLSHHV